MNAATAHGVAAYARKSSRYSFPTGWFYDTSRYANVMNQLEVKDMNVKYVGPGNSEQDAAAIRTDHPVPLDCPLYYFEVTIICEGAKGLIGVGLSGKDVELSRLPGWDPHSFGYHGDDGNMFPGRGNGTLYGPTFTRDDTIGCYWNRAERVIGYMKNGINLGIAFRDVDETILFPTVGFRTPNEEVYSSRSRLYERKVCTQVKANFGETQFVADLDAMWREQSQRVKESLKLTKIETPKVIDAHVTSNSIVPLPDCLLCHCRVDSGLSYPPSLLQSAAFFLTAAVEILSDQDEANILARQRIYEAVLSGNIDEALSQTDAIAPGTLERHPRILFKLRCQKFMQMVQNPDEDTHSALQFGRTFLTPSCPSQEDEAFLSEVPAGAIPNFRVVAQVLTLIAYETPAQSPCGYLLKPEYKQELAEDLNSAILENQGHRPKPPLEVIYKQLFTSVDELTKAFDLDCQFVDFQKMLIDDLPSKE